jgi:pyrroline-5-carboxylate reductase
MLKEKKITIIGGGKMGSIIARGLIDNQIASSKNIIITDIDASRLDFLRSSMKLKVSTHNEKSAKNADIIILAVKPQNMASTLKEIYSVIDKSKLVISIAAGISGGFVFKNSGMKEFTGIFMPPPRQTIPAILWG